MSCPLQSTLIFNTKFHFSTFIPFYRKFPSCKCEIIIPVLLKLIPKKMCHFYTLHTNTCAGMRYTICTRVQCNSFGAEIYLVFIKLLVSISLLFIHSLLFSIIKFWDNLTWRLRHTDIPKVFSIFVVFWYDKILKMSHVFKFISGTCSNLTFKTSALLLLLLLLVKCVKLTKWIRNCCKWIKMDSIVANIN